VNILGTAFLFFDTAGIRETTDEIETLGIERNYSKFDLATVVILVVDTLNEIEIIAASLLRPNKRPI